jgi:hypothetical protein
MSDSQLTYLVIPARLAEPTFIGQCPTSFTLPFMQKAVGGYIELVSLRLADMFINEEGKLQDLPVNVRATHLAWHNKAIAIDDVINGNSILFGKCDSEGNTTSITAEFRSHLIKVLGGHA